MLGPSPRRKPFPKIELNTLNLGGSSAFSGIGGPQPQDSPQQPLRSNLTNESEPTIRPADHTISPQHPPPHMMSMADLETQVKEFEQWSDDMLEEVGRLGEGAGGAVYKVRDRRTGVVMARKTITTHEAPMKQLLREIKITSSTEHVNIVHFYGAYISPSSSEVKVLMEYAEGGSLESVGKRMREIGARVGEKVAGRLAEGVSACSSRLVVGVGAFNSVCRICLRRLVTPGCGGHMPLGRSFRCVCCVRRLVWEGRLGIDWLTDGSGLDWCCRSCRGSRTCTHARQSTAISSRQTSSSRARVSSSSVTLVSRAS